MALPAIWHKDKWTEDIFVHRSHCSNIVVAFVLPSPFLVVLHHWTLYVVVTWYGQVSHSEHISRTPSIPSAPPLENCIYNILRNK